MSGMGINARLDLLLKDQLMPPLSRSNGFAASDSSGSVCATNPGGGRAYKHSPICHLHEPQAIMTMLNIFVNNVVINRRVCNASQKIQ